MHEHRDWGSPEHSVGHQERIWKNHPGPPFFLKAPPERGSEERRPRRILRTGRLQDESGEAEDTSKTGAGGGEGLVGGTGGLRGSVAGVAGGRLGGSRIVGLRGSTSRVRGSRGATAVRRVSNHRSRDFSFLQTGGGYQVLHSETTDV